MGASHGYVGLLKFCPAISRAGGGLRNRARKALRKTVIAPIIHVKPCYPRPRVYADIPIRQPRAKTHALQQKSLLDHPLSDRQRYNEISRPRTFAVLRFIRKLEVACSNPLPKPHCPDDTGEENVTLEHLEHIAGFGVRFHHGRPRPRRTTITAPSHFLRLAATTVTPTTTAAGPAQSRRLSTDAMPPTARWCCGS